MNSYLKLVLFTAIFVATTFTFSCSGDDGKDGTSCVLAGNVLTCGETSYTLPEDAAGPGDPGQPGRPGVDCSLDAGPEKFTITCGSNTATYAYCGNRIYNEAIYKCDENGIAWFSFTDPRNNIEYKAVVIGPHIWMAENLNFPVIDGSSCYDNQAANCAIYGRLYDYETAQNACPVGWHLPSQAEFNSLVKLADPDHDVSASDNKSGEALRTKSGWEALPGNSKNGNDNLGFSAMPSGIWESGQWYRRSATYWGETDDENKVSLLIVDTRSFAVTGAFSLLDNDKYSIRCVKD